MRPAGVCHHAGLSKAYTHRVDGGAVCCSVVCCSAKFYRKIVTVSSVSELRGKIPSSNLELAFPGLTQSRYACYTLLRCTSSAALYQLCCAVPALLRCTSSAALYQLCCAVPALLRCTSSAALYQLCCAVPALLRCTSSAALYQLCVGPCLDLDCASHVLQGCYRQEQ